MKQLKISELITRRDSESIAKLFRDINRLPVPTAAEEEALAQRIAQGDITARNELVARNIRFVVTVAKQSQGCGLCLEDLIDEGVLGLIEAAKRFDVTRGFKFCTYAVWWIRQAINKAIGDYGSAIRIPGNQRVQRNKLVRIKNEFTLTNDREPTNAELAELANVSLDQVDGTEQLPSSIKSIDKPFGEDTDDLCLNDVLASEDTADRFLEQESLKIDVHTALMSLTERERYVLTLIFGLNGESEHTVEDIASRLTISPERVRQIRDRAYQRIRHNKACVELLSQYAA